MDFKKIGKLAGTHGLDGKLVINHNLQGKNIWKKIPHVFVELHRESYIPFFIEEMKVMNDEEVLVVLDEIYSVEAAKKMSGKSVYLSTETWDELQPNVVSLTMVGFTITDKTIGKIGLIEDLFETPGQVLASVLYQNKEVMIPLIPSTIIEVNAMQKNILVQLPDGLLEVYL